MCRWSASIRPSAPSTQPGSRLVDRAFVTGTSGSGARSARSRCRAATHCPGSTAPAIRSRPEPFARASRAGQRDHAGGAARPGRGYLRSLSHERARLGRQPGAPVEPAFRLPPLRDAAVLLSAAGHCRAGTGPACRAAEGLRASSAARLVCRCVLSASACRYQLATASVSRPAGRNWPP